MPRDVDPAVVSQTVPSVAAQQVLRPKASISIAAPKPRPLGDRETLSSFNSWHSTVTFYLSQEPNYIPFICGDIQKWQKDSGQPGCLRGLIDHVSGTPTAETSCFYLNQLLGLLAQWAPYYLHHAIRYESTCLEDVWLSIRKFYGLKQSETQFMKFTDIVCDMSDQSSYITGLYITWQTTC